MLVKKYRPDLLAKRLAKQLEKEIDKRILNRLVWYVNKKESK